MGVKMGAETNHCEGCRARQMALDAANKHIALMRKKMDELHDLVSKLAVAHVTLDDEETPGEDYDKWFDQYRDAINGMVAYWQKNLTTEGAKTNESSSQTQEVRGRQQD